MRDVLSRTSQQRLRIAHGRDVGPLQRSARAGPCPSNTVFVKHYVPIQGVEPAPAGGRKYG